MSTSFFPARILSGLNLAGSIYAVIISMSSYLYQFCGVWKKPFLWSHPPSLAPAIFLPPLPHRCVGLEKRWVLQMSHLRLGVPVFLTLCPWSSYGSGCYWLSTATILSGDTCAKFYKISKWYKVQKLTPNFNSLFSLFSDSQKIVQIILHIFDWGAP